MKGPPEVVAVGEGYGVDHDVQGAELLPDLLVRRLDVLVGGHVALDDRRVAPGLHQLGDAFLDALVLVGDGEGCARLV